MNRTKIEWADFTWNPIVGCTHGCPYCYARRFAKRQKCPQCREFTPHLHPERLDEPLRKRKPSRIFVCSMADLFDPLTGGVESGRVMHGRLWTQVCDVMADVRAQHHTFIVLTKQPEIMWRRLATRYHPIPRNWWLGVSVTNQEDADERIPALLSIKAAVRFISLEPLLGPVDLHPLWLDARSLSWVIVGAQTGPGAVAPKPEWIESIIWQCRVAGVPLFLKDNLKWPKVIREFPKA
ncbi:MAG: DUF5131 family protein [bacterium]